MACATLKRSLDWESLNSPARPAKRRRCNPLGQSPYRQRYTVMQDPNLALRQVATTPFKQNTFSDKVSSRIAESLCEKIRTVFPVREIERMQDGEAACGFETGSESPRSSQSMSDEQIKRKVFTFKQVKKICQELLEEQEEEIKEKYDGLLMCRLAEQYDTFVKFTHDQIHRQYDQSAPSYLS